MLRNKHSAKFHYSLGLIGLFFLSFVANVVVSFFNVYRVYLGLL